MALRLRGDDGLAGTCLLLGRILANHHVQEEMWRLGRELVRGK